MKALIIATDGFEDIELTYPYYRLKEEKINVRIASPNQKEITGKHQTSIEPELPIKNLEPKEYEILIIPGGHSPEHLRIEQPKSIDLVKSFYNQNRLITAICHGPQLLMSAGVLENKKATCYRSVK